jgi:SEC-C motif-containing protein
MTASATPPPPASTPLETLAAKLRLELIPSTTLEELFFDAIVRLSVCASFLGRHIEADPEFANPESSRRLRLLHSTEGKLRYAYEEYRRLKMARQIQLDDPGQARRPLLTIVATHTTRSGFRSQRRAAAAPLAPAPSTPSRALAANAAQVAPVTRVAAPGRNAPCPCNSGRKYKHCCLNKPVGRVA